ncbi:hypothetical protein HBH56_175730 [Parastagonospora nodorum]|nr:hypothetical protein HBH56_175730 [Parastagonospora nodorum]KAH3926261.1 hypothetical protein HBH54_167440 [Parastagonospora nodorum]KAH3965631.1 hypothetical protein HBH52_204100 [Parastagonospora nodorum]KAH3971341.1 hypothetical protein HBH51_109810 [Parastagonospora nodorum]KAH4041371.1 hypothetical protein HBI09_021730 [Parastagonospora nodorum]
MSGRRVEHLKIPAVRSKCHHHNRQRRVVVERMVSVEAGFRRDAADPALSVPDAAGGEDYFTAPTPHRAAIDQISGPPWPSA